MTTLHRTVFPALLLAAGLLGQAHAAPAPDEVVQVQVQLAAEAPRAEAPVHVEAGRAEIAEHLDPLVIAGIAAAIGAYSVVSGIRRRRAEQDGCPKPV